MFSNLSGRQGMSIFNRRRRPRQAVYASPQSQEVQSTSFTTVPDEELAKMAQDFETGPGNYNLALNSPTTHFNKPYNPRPLQNRNVALYKHPNNKLKSMNTTQVKQENHSFENKTNSCAYPVGQQQKMGTPQHYYTTNNSSKEFHFSSSGVLKQQSYQTQQSHQPQQFHQAQGQFSWNSTYSPAKGRTASPGTAKQPVENAKSYFGGTENQYQNLKTEKPMNAVSKNSTSSETFTLKTVDKSMKFVTANIQGLQKWNEHREQLPLVFEIFATLDSVPTSNNNGTAKFFNIKDFTGSIRCVYWEMDQKLPRVARGHTYRLTGALERKTGHFQCFTIRQAQPTEEKVAPSQIALCDSALTKVIAMIAEA